jgi:catechol 2,3-dioxygenase-like lactoylglutathione lyase family enzyme
MGTARLSHLFVVVADLAVSRAFYERIGLEVLLEEDGYVRLGGGDGFHVGMEEAAPGSPLGPSGIEIVVQVDDVDRRFDELRAAGLEFDAEPADMPWGARHAWFRDPDGNRLSIYSNR